MSFTETYGLSFEEAVQGLDELKVERDGNVQYCIGLLSTLYFKNGDDPAVRDRVVEGFEYYQQQTDFKLLWGADPKTGTPKKLAGTQIADLRTWVPNLHPKKSLELMFHGGQKRDDASHYTLTSLVQQEYPGEISYFSATLPLTWIAHQPQGAYIKLVLKLCDILHPYHGYAGLALIPFVNNSTGGEIMNELRGVVTRFRGLEFDIPWSHSMYLEDSIKGVNWLTILDNAWFDKLGGRAKLEKELGDGFVFHDFKTGVAIQAGPHPAFGDVNRNEKLPHYIKLSKALKPIRVDYQHSFGRMGYFNKDQAQQWLARFDEENEP